MDESKKNERLQQLTDIQYNVTQKAGTERPFQNEFYDNEKAFM
ncbi:Peptide methionine sulfoxide reductase MsrB [Listeria monocytogenes N53-1]|nr:Peptide methionine sulfoxide reductase MsrB [Listeria monocytogenes]CCQ24516.1 Peptide methionine sulfoxide reductase MsrB [Listeria monocytogenes N53-1]